MVQESQEQFDASTSGSITSKTPGEPDWCWQMVSRLQTLWKSLDIDLDLYLGAWEEADEHRIWEKIPYDAPFGSKEAMLEGLGVGDDAAARARVAAQASITVPLQRHGGHLPKNGKEPAAGQVPYGSNSTDYLTARIARDHPEIFTRMKNGEFDSVAAAAREAGIYKERTKSVGLIKDVDRVADNIRKHYTPEQVKALKDAL